MILAVLIVLGLVFAVIVVVVIFGGVLKTESTQAKAERNADALLDAEFDGRPDVVFKINMVGLKFETVVLGAKQRGYKLVSQAENQYGPSTLIFEKTTNSPAQP